MKVRRRAMPLDPQTQGLVARGLIQDPRKGKRESRGNHAPKMRVNNDPRPILHNHHGER